jgi:hypothetical protein
VTVMTITVPTCTAPQSLSAALRRAALSRPSGLGEADGATTVHHPVPRELRGPGRVSKSVTGTSGERVGAAAADRPYAAWLPGLLGERAS